MKPIITHISAFLGILFFEGFSRLIISFYHRIDYQFAGISHLPDPSWIIVLLLTVFISTWLMAMLALTILNRDALTHTLILGGIVVLWRGLEIYHTIGTSSEPLWYVSLVFILHLVALALAYKLYHRQHEIIASKS